MLARIPLIPIVLLASCISIVAMVLWLWGAPMAGTWSALAAAAVAGALTIPMALAFSHHEGVDSGH
jgi:O-antigen/teichoic acid export membrane protein